MLDFSQRESERERFIAGRLRPIRIVCMALAGASLAYGILGWFLIEGFQMRPFGRLPRPVPLALSFLAMVMILLGSRIRTSILRSGLPSGLMRSTGVPVNLESLIPAYIRATLVSFALLEAAALIGLMIALFAESSFYGMVFSVGSFLSMLLRWPKAEEVDRLARGRISP